MKFTFRTVLELTPTWKKGGTIALKEDNMSQSSGMQWTAPWGSALPPPLICDDAIRSEKCPICFENDVMGPPPEFGTDAESYDKTKTCRCQVCRGCLATWFVKHPERPTCPVCLIELDRRLLVERLNMDPQIENSKDVNKETNDATLTETSAVDDLTQDWFEEHERKVKQCPNPNCGVWIWKSGGCAHMTCYLCEYEFCWFCMKNMNDQCKFECNGWNEYDEEEEDDEDDAQT